VKSFQEWMVHRTLEERDACIPAISSSGCTFLGINLSCKLRALIPRPGIDPGFKFSLVKVSLCMYPNSLHLQVYEGEGKGIGFIHSIF
jgi:hypothetical protein